MPTNMKQFTVKLPRKILEFLQIQKEKFGVSTSSFIRICVLESLVARGVITSTMDQGGMHGAREATGRITK